MQCNHVGVRDGWTMVFAQKRTIGQRWIDNKQLDVKTSDCLCPKLQCAVSFAIQKKLYSLFVWLIRIVAGS